MNLKKQSDYLKKQLKSNKKFSQSKMAKYCGVSAAMVSMWVNGKQPISDNKIDVVSEYLKVNRNELNNLTLLTIVEKNETMQDSADTHNQKYESIKHDLTQQLESQGKFGMHYSDLIDHAVYLYRLKDELQFDIDSKGLRIVMMTGNGISRESDNTSIKNIVTVSGQLIRVLKSLGLEEPTIEDIDDDAL